MDNAQQENQPTARRIQQPLPIGGGAQGALPEHELADEEINATVRRRGYAGAHTDISAGIDDLSASTGESTAQEAAQQVNQLQQEVNDLRQELNELKELLGGEDAEKIQLEGCVGGVSMTVEVAGRVL